MDRGPLLNDVDPAAFIRDEYSPAHEVGRQLPGRAASRDRPHDDPRHAIDLLDLTIEYQADPQRRAVGAQGEAFTGSREGRARVRAGRQRQEVELVERLIGDV